MYPYFRSWMSLRRRLDPPGIFGNAYLDRIFGAEGGGGLNASRTASTAANLFARKNFEPTISSVEQSSASSPKPVPEGRQQQKEQPQPQPPSSTSASTSASNEGPGDLLSTSWSSIASTETTEDVVMKMDDDECDSIATLLTAASPADNKEVTTEKVEVVEEAKPADGDHVKNGDNQQSGGDDQQHNSPSTSATTTTTTSSSSSS